MGFDVDVTHEWLWKSVSLKTLWSTKEKKVRRFPETTQS